MCDGLGTGQTGLLLGKKKKKPSRTRNNLVLSHFAATWRKIHSGLSLFCVKMIPVLHSAVLPGFSRGCRRIPGEGNPWERMFCLALSGKVNCSANSSLKVAK